MRLGDQDKKLASHIIGETRLSNFTGWNHGRFRGNPKTMLHIAISGLFTSKVTI